MTRPTLIHTCTASLLALVLGASIALASASEPAPVNPRPGKFKGRTGQHKAMSIRVSRGRVTTISFGLTLRCTDGTRMGFPIHFRDIATPIAAGTFNRSWSDTSDLGYPFTTSISGSFSSNKRARGTISLGVNRPDHGGGCVTGPWSTLGPSPVSWKASRAVTAVGR